ncbi:MAG: homoserine kinase [Myxococcales bacterium]|nr:homoserine kinase [Myxococcales bacterium]
MGNLIGRIRTAFAPATVANVGPGFDVLGLAVSFPGDTVSVEAVDEPGVQLVKITGDGGLLPTDPQSNTAAVAATKVLDLLGLRDTIGVRLTLNKGLPLGSGMGSSGASAVAAALATANLVDTPPPRIELLNACREGEAIACGSPHADNVAPSLVGGIVLLRPSETLDVISLPVPRGLYCALAHPSVVIRTADARAALPKAVPLPDAVYSGACLASLVSALYDRDFERLARSIDDRLATPTRSRLIPGYDAVRASALAAGAVGCSISGSGPTMFAFAVGAKSARRVAKAMRQTFLTYVQSCEIWACPVDNHGAKLVIPAG